MIFLLSMALFLCAFCFLRYLFHSLMNWMNWLEPPESPPLPPPKLVPIDLDIGEVEPRGVALADLEITKDPVCSICKSKTKDEEAVHCGRCKAAAHKDCFEFNGKCGVFACGNKTSATLICGSKVNNKIPIECAQGHLYGFPHYNPYNCPDCGRLIT